MNYENARMNYYVQHHNVANEGLPFASPPFSGTRLNILTRRPNVRTAEGRVFLIAGMGQTRRYFLWETFQVESVKAKAVGVFEVSGTGWQLSPPTELTGKPFQPFKEACAGFVGFRCINELPFTQTLNKLAEVNKPPDEPEKIIDFLNTIAGLFADDAPERGTIR